jgi:hypothetical protein
MMNFRTIGLCVAAIAGLTACGGGGSSATSANAPSIVGTWGNTGNAAETDTFNSDNTFALSQSGCTYTGGTYSVSGNKVTVTKAPTAAAPSGTSPAGTCNAAAAAGLATYSFTYTISGNSLTYVDSNSKTTTVFPLVGKWNSIAGTATYTFTINADKTYVFAASDTSVAVGTCTFTGGTYTVSGESFTFVTSPTTGTPSANTISCNTPTFAGKSSVVTISSATSMTDTDNTSTTTYTRI